MHTARSMLLEAILIGIGARAVQAFGSIPHHNTFTLCNPDPSLLVWDKAWDAATPGGEGREGLLLNVGWLKVPILYDQPGLEALGTPLGYTAIRVSTVTKCAAGAKPILTHCGGPGTTNDCLLMTKYYPAFLPMLKDGTYDNLAITQRGVSNDNNPATDPTDKWAAVPFFQEDGTRVKPFPQITCYSPMSKSALDAVRKARGCLPRPRPRREHNVAAPYGHALAHAQQ